MAYGDAVQSDAISVFVSYSRSDTDFALDLVDALQACGFRAYIDQEDIAPGEPWEERLSGLIESADTVVYVLSPDSLTSEHCAWEVERTLQLNKRLLPAVWRRVEDDKVPKALAQLNYTFFSGKNSFANGLKELSAALRVDHNWIREHTRIGNLARRWQARGRSESLLLRGEELDAATQWAARRPPNAPALSDEQVDLIAESQSAHDKAERVVRNRRRGLLIAVSSVAVGMAGLAGAVGYQWLEAERNRAYAVEAWDELTQTNDQLQAAYVRLSADLSLRAPPTGRDDLQIPGGWFPVAANYSGAVARLVKVEDGSRQIITGMLIEGSMIHPDMMGETFLLSPQFAAGEAAIDQNNRLTDFLDATDELGADGAESFQGQRFTRAFVDPDIMSNTVPITPPPGQPETSDDLEVLTKPFVGTLEEPEEPEILAQTYLDEPTLPVIEAPFDDDNSGMGIMEQRAILPSEDPSLGDGTNGMTLSFPALRDAGPVQLGAESIWATPVELEAEPQFVLHQLPGDVPFGVRPLQINDLDCTREGGETHQGDRFALFGIDGLAAKGQVLNEELTLLVTEGTVAEANGRITYRHATLLGAYGAPVFDLTNGKVVGIHQGVVADVFGPDGRVGIAEPLLPLINFIRDEVSIDRGDAERTAPLCRTE